MKKAPFIIAVGILVSGCDNFLNESLQGEYSSSTFYKTAEHAKLAVTACYEPLAFKSIENNIWVFGDVASDDAVKGGNAGDQSEMTYIDQFTVATDNGFLVNCWEHYFNGIARTNEVIEKVPLIDMDTDLRDRYVGEAKFLRAYYYFNLVNIFGTVPLIISPVETTEDLYPSLSTVDDVYTQIEEDLLSATLSLPATVSSADFGRATKGAAFGMLAKVCLYEEKYSEVLQYIDSLDALGLYSLMPLFKQNFMLDFENNSESVFEVQHLSGQDPMVGSALNQWFAPATENGYYFDVPTQDFVDEFEITGNGIVDPRLDYTVGREGQLWLNGESFDPGWSPTGYLQKKNLQPLSEIPKGTKGDGDLNYTYLRYSDLLLMKAEALNELERSDEALLPLNEVRKRARESFLYDSDLDGYGAVPANLLPDLESTSQSVVRDAIRHERRVELGFEFHRFFDLMRYGRISAEAALSGTGFTYESDRYFPVPQGEIDTNPNISY